MLLFNRKYLFLALLIFLAELLIALFVHDRFVRPYIGDLLVVVLLYCFAKAFLRLPPLPVAMGVLLFAYATELLQYFEIVEKLGLSHSKLARIVIGTSFCWEDLLAYTLGIAATLLLEKLANQGK